MGHLVREPALGPVLHVHRLTHPLIPAGVYLGGAALTLWAYLALETLAAEREERALSGRLETTIEFVELALAVFGGFLVLAALLVLNAGQRTFYLCAGGFIDYRNGQALAYPWGEIETLLLVRHDTGERTGEIHRYRIVPRHGRPITVPAEPHPFSQALVEAMLRAGRPVSDP